MIICCSNATLILGESCSQDVEDPEELCEEEGDHGVSHGPHHDRQVHSFFISLFYCNGYSHEIFFMSLK